MSYQVLARKWRPRDFESTVGQEHVVRALTHALAAKRLHHAYLFTGTRGVGKTTLARILAKALNCVGPDGQGDVTPQPCNRCPACEAIDAGRFVDYIELDAASNRGVDEMTQLLERAVYAPSNARFKVYMIDEVHMLTTHAFNAMLKTLEEPPEYVKFVLATTDPQKIPVTVLSRCLQFSLKPMPPALIAEELARILAAESIEADPAALRAIAQSARGSMRDALSLLDQAIAYGGGSVTQASVRGMLGSIDGATVARLLQSVVAGDAPALLSQADEMASNGLSFGQALRDLAALMHRIALQQLVPDAADDDPERAALVRDLAARIAPEDVQLYYQIALHGRNDLHLAPDEYAGFTMALMRMVAFRPDSGTQAAGATAGAARPASSAAPVRTAAPLRSAMPPRAIEPLPPASAHLPNAPKPPVPRVAPQMPAAAPRHAAAAQDSAQPQPPAPEGTAGATAAAPFDGNWPALAARLQQGGLGGLAAQLAARSELLAHDPGHFRLRVPIRTLLDAGAAEKLAAALTAHFGHAVRVSGEVGTPQGATAAVLAEQAEAARLQRASDAIYADPFVRELTSTFGAQVDPDSIRPAAASAAAEGAGPGAESATGSAEGSAEQAAAPGTAAASAASAAAASRAAGARSTR